MKLKGNNAEKIATTLIIFILTFMAYLLVCLIFNYLVDAKLENVVKDGMSFAAICATPIIAILLFNDWREEHQIKSLFSILDLINSKAIEIELLNLDYVDAVIKEEKIDQLEMDFTKSLIQMSLLYREIRHEMHLDEYLRMVSNLHTELRYLNNLSIVMKENWNIVKKFEEFNKTRDSDDQIYPIPQKDAYESNRHNFIMSATAIEKLINNMIDESRAIKRRI